MDNLENAGNAMEKGDVATAEKIEPAESVRTYAPNVDIVDTENETVLLADMPGVDGKDIEIMLERNILTLRGRPAEEKREGRDLVYSEYAVGPFERSFTIGEDANRDAISASMKDGVLTVNIPKSVPASRKISVASAR